MSSTELPFRTPTLIRQRYERDCVIAAVAMITGEDYDTVAAVAGQDERGGSRTREDGLLAHYGYAVARFYRSDAAEGEWPPQPFAQVHLCNVDVNDNAPCTHQVVMLADGKVLDPLCDQPKRLMDYFKVNNVAAVVRWRGIQQPEEDSLNPFDTLLPKTMYAIVHGQEAAKYFNAINPAEAAGWERLSSIYQMQFRKARGERTEQALPVPQVRALVAQWRKQALHLHATMRVARAAELRQCADELEGALNGK